MKSKKTDYQNHTFYFNTKLSEARMKMIDDWINRLNSQELGFLMDFMNDVREAYEFDARQKFYEEI